jgi:hypothetical protein
LRPPLHPSTNALAGFGLPWHILASAFTVSVCLAISFTLPDPIRCNPLHARPHVASCRTRPTRQPTGVASGSVIRPPQLVPVRPTSALCCSSGAAVTARRVIGIKNVCRSPGAHHPEQKRLLPQPGPAARAEVSHRTARCGARSLGGGSAPATPHTCVAATRSLYDTSSHTRAQSEHSQRRATLSNRTSEATPDTRGQWMRWKEEKEGRRPGGIVIRKADRNAQSLRPGRCKRNEPNKSLVAADSRAWWQTALAG